MAKTIKITFYNPKELWKMFWTWAFWPRRKKCAEWAETFRYRLEHVLIYDLLIRQYYDRGVLGDTAVESLEIDIKKIIKDECDKMKQAMTKPLYD